VVRLSLSIVFMATSTSFWVINKRGTRKDVYVLTLASILTRLAC